MKKLKYGIGAFALLTLTVSGFVSCLRGGTLESITVTPVNQYMARGTTQQFTATARFSDGTTLDWTSASAWSSTSTTVATITDTPGLSGSGIVTANSITAATIDTTVIKATDTANNISELSYAHGRQSDIFRDNAGKSLHGYQYLAPVYGDCAILGTHPDADSEPDLIRNMDDIRHWPDSEQHWPCLSRNHHDHHANNVCY